MHATTAVPPCMCVPQGSRLKRELERVTEERDRAREEGKRAEQQRQQLELDLKVGGCACVRARTRAHTHTNASKQTSKETGRRALRMPAVDARLLAGDSICPDRLQAQAVVNWYSPPGRVPLALHTVRLCVMNLLAFMKLEAVPYFLCIHKCVCARPCKSVQT